MKIGLPIRWCWCFKRHRRQSTSIRIWVTKAKNWGKFAIFQTKYRIHRGSKQRKHTKERKRNWKVRMLGDFIFDKENETQMIMKPRTKVWCLYCKERSLPYSISIYIEGYIVVKGIDFAFFFEICWWWILYM